MISNITDRQRKIYLLMDFHKVCILTNNNSLENLTNNQQFNYYQSMLYRCHKMILQNNHLFDNFSNLFTINIHNTIPNSLLLEKKKSKSYTKIRKCIYLLNLFQYFTK
jgi:hypothetical protein